jgi:hypothetical protein
MTREEFIEVLKKRDYSYIIGKEYSYDKDTGHSSEIEGNIVVTDKGDVYLDRLTSLPPGVEFKNGGTVYLESLTSISPGVEFKNGWSVNLHSLTSIPPGFVFKNGGNVYLDALTSIPSGVEFKNGANVNLGSLIGVWFDDWKGNIKGIKSKRLLNLMISKGIFER